MPPLRLLERLADGRFHSGQSLADALGISRTAVWKQVQRLRGDFGLDVDAVRGRGYRLPAGLELLDVARIRAHISGPARRRLAGIDVLATTPSTNAHAATRLPTHAGTGRAWLAEHQTAGRGRRGRHWESAFGRNICLSVAWHFELAMSQLSALSLAAGVAVAEGLGRLGVRGHALKWPNDLMCGERKLAGILVEVSGETGGPATAVIGVGVNVRMPASHGAGIDQPWTDLDALGFGDVSRNALAGTLIDGLAAVCDDYAVHGLGGYRDRWLAFDALHGRTVRLVSGEHVVEGRYAGIAENGALILHGADGSTEHLAGEVSLRPGEAL